MGFKGKPKKGKGGGRIQITNIEELQLRNEHFDTQQRERKARRGDSDEDDSDEDGDNGNDNNSEDAMEVSSHLEKLSVKEGNTGEGNDSVFNFKKSPGLLDSVKKNTNPNKQKKPERMLNAKERAALGGSEGGPVPDNLGGLTRKQREAIEAARRKEAYMQKTLAGETEEGKRNLERLAAVKKRREEAARKLEAEGGGKPGSGGKGDKDDAVAASPLEDSKAAAKKKAAAASTDNDDDGSIPKLKSIEIKKMNPAALKDALKARDLSIQGQKKELIARLTEYEAAR